MSFLFRYLVNCGHHAVFYTVTIKSPGSGLKKRHTIKYAQNVTNIIHQYFNVPSTGIVPIKIAWSAGVRICNWSSVTGFLFCELVIAYQTITVVYVSINSLFETLKLSKYKCINFYVSNRECRQLCGMCCQALLAL